MKLSKAQLYKITQSGALLDNMVDNLDKKALINLSVLLAKDVLPKLATKATNSLLDKFEKK